MAKRKVKKGRHRSNSKKKNHDLVWANDRTRLANERTLLAYWRTALTSFGIGLIVLKFFTNKAFLAAGIFLFISLFLLYLGTKSYIKYKRKLNGD